MIIVGLVLVVAGAAFGIDVAMKNRFSVRDVEAFGSSLGLHHAEQIFILGAITGAVILLGLALMIAGISRNSSRTAAHRRQRRDLGETNQQAADTNAENQRMRSSGTAASPTAESDVNEVRAEGSGDTRVSTSSGGSTAINRGD